VLPNLILPRRVFPLETVLVKQYYALTYEAKQDGKFTCKLNNEGRLPNDCYHGKALHILSVCLCVFLTIQHSKRMRRIILSSVARSDLPCFPTIFGKMLTKYVF